MSFDLFLPYLKCAELFRGKDANANWLTESQTSIRCYEEYISCGD